LAVISKLADSLTQKGVEPSAFKHEVEKSSNASLQLVWAAAMAKTAKAMARIATVLMLSTL
jgi:hypothetical protein